MRGTEVHEYAIQDSGRWRPDSGLNPVHRTFSAAAFAGMAFDNKWWQETKDNKIEVVGMNEDDTTTATLSAYP